MEPRSGKPDGVAESSSPGELETGEVGQRREFTGINIQ